MQKEQDNSGRGKVKEKCKGCKHHAKFHHVSDYEKTLGRIICSRYNCLDWQFCDQDGWDKTSLLGKHK